MKKLLITGADGLVGHAFQNLENQYPQYKFLFNRRGSGVNQEFWNTELVFVPGDLRNIEEVKRIFQNTKPDIVIHLGARVGGIQRNLSQPAQQFDDNILINTNTIIAARECNVEKFIGCGSVCAFPGNADLLTEENYLQGEPYPAHKSYAYSKRMMTIQLEAYKQQYNFNSCTILPTNLYGKHDNYNMLDGHVIACLTHKAYLAEKTNTQLEVWGDGSPIREFVYSEDLARICMKLLELDEMPSRLIIPGEEKSILEVTGEICYNFIIEKPVHWNTDKPNGQMKRKTDPTLFNKTFPDFKFTNFEDGIKTSIEWFKENYPNVRN